jgi:hypothetical protein
MHKLNQELLEVLSATAHWLESYAEKNGVPFPNLSTYNSLVNKADALIKEIAAKSPMELLNRRIFTEKPNRRRRDRIKIYTLYKGV